MPCGSVRSVPAPPARLAVAALLAPAVLLLAAAGPAAAQDGESPGLRQHRGGFWLSGGLGVGLDEEGEAGGAGYLRLGGTLGDHWALGFEALGLSRDAGDEVTVTPEQPVDATVTRGNATGTVYFFPSVESGFFVKGGLGIATIEAEVDVEDVTVSTDDESLGATLGAGWDLQLGDGNLYLTPNLDLVLQGLDTSADALFLATVGIGFR